ncbi:MAG: hypothetical protein JJW03_00075, partial [Desulfosarcina sp.]|nr:hypothetical protein [Desulfobacterales bacterium]
MFKRSVIISIGLFIFLLICLLGPLPTGSYEQAIAQKALDTAGNNDVVKELASENVGIDASKLLEHINATAKDGKRYINAMKTASDEDLLVIQLQFFSLQQRMINYAHKLTDAMLDQEKKGKQPELRREVEEALTRITPRLWININRLRGEIDAVRARRIKAPVKERLAIENEVLKLTARLDKMYAMSLSHIEKMDQAGMDTGRAMANLTKLLAERADELYGRIALAIDRFDDLETRRKKIPDDADVARLLIAASKSLDTNTASMEVSLGLMKAFKLDTNLYRAQLVQATKDISSGLFDTGVALSIAGHAMKRVTSWIFDKGPKVFLKLLLFFG